MSNFVKILLLLGLGLKTQGNSSFTQLESGATSKNISRYESFCLQGNPPDLRFFHHNNQQQNVTLLVNHKLETRLIGTIFKIFAREKLGYDISMISDDDGDNKLTDTDEDTTFRKLSSCTNEFCNDLDDHPDKGKIGSNMLKVPDGMIALDVPMAASSYVDKWGLVDVGQLGPASRLGWFIPHRTEQNFPPPYDHWKVFKDESSADLFTLTPEQEMFIKEKVKIKSDVVGGVDRYFCEQNFCKRGHFTPSHCHNRKCAVLLAEYPAVSSSQKTSLVVDLIMTYGLNVKVAYLGPNLEATVKFMDRSSRAENNSYCVFHYTPSVLTAKYNLSAILFPECEDPLIERPDNKPECMFAPNRLAKVVWKPVQNRAPDLFNFIENFSFDWGEYVTLLEMFNNDTTDNEEDDEEERMQRVACAWLNHDIEIPVIDYDNHQVQRQAWADNFPVTVRNQLYIGGIFPIKGTKFRAPELGPVAIMAVEDINKNPNILPRHRLVLDIQDGKCEADVVMKKFIDFIKNKDPSRFRSTVGILGPACSNTVEPIAGVSKHYRTLVISYSAEGSISNDHNQEFPYFFRTIAENKQYKHAYLAALQKFEWQKVASLTQDGSKYSHYMSSLQDQWKMDETGIDFVLNRKFPRDTKDMSLYLKDLKEKGAKIIIADFYEPAARHIMCQAYKLKMTQAQGYVWFLPGWFKEAWYDIDDLKDKEDKNEDHPNNDNDDEVKMTALKHLPNCTTNQLLQALDGALSLVHNNYAPDESLTVGNFSVGDWKQRLDKLLKTIFRRSKFNTDIGGIRFEDGKASKYSGYVYDAVWMYALALDQMINSDTALIQDLHSEKTVNELVKIIKELDFEGVSGRIKFENGHSRLSEIKIQQFEVKREVEIFRVGNTDIIPSELMVKEIGLYRPQFGNTSDITWYDHRIRWKTKSGEKPTDKDRSCGPLTPFAILLNLECQLTITVAFLIVFGLVLGMLLGLFVGLKMRYEKKMKDQEERMRALGLLTPMTVLALDDWEMARDRVVINRKLGEGAFGMVYGGEAFFDDRGWVAVAVKTLKTGSTVEEKIDFLSEADMMKRFEHKNIVKLLGVCTRNEPVYTVMEYMLYGDLKTYLLARRNLVAERNREELDEVSNKRLTSMASDVASGLAFLHEQKYVHRDVACRNCLVNASRTIKLADFGMTRPMFESDYYRFSRRGMLPVRWMSPESLADGIFTPMSDVWSYGVLLYEIITFGSFPFQGLSNNQVLENVKNGQTLTQPVGIKSQLGSLLRSCWSPTPTKRPSASEIVELLTNNPRLISPCIDVPLASVQIERTDSLELLPVSKRSPTHATIIGTLDPVDGKTNLTSIKNIKLDSRNGYYSPMHGNGIKADRFMISKSSPSNIFDNVANNTSGGLSGTSDSNGYYRPESDVDTRDPLITSKDDFNNQLTVGSYVQPGYIYVCENYA